MRISWTKHLVQSETGFGCLPKKLRQVAPRLRRWGMLTNRAVITTTGVIALQFSIVDEIRGANNSSGTSPMIVAAFGTSLTYRAGWLEPLQEKLTRCLGREVTVLDFGKDGETSAGGLRSVGRVVEARPDVVLIEFSANDAAWFKGVSLQRSRRNTAEIVEAILGTLPKTKIFLMTMSPALGLRGWIRPNLDAYYSLYESLASELGAGYIDTRPAWKALKEVELRTGIPDGAHPLPELASRLLVPRIAKAIVPQCAE
jgi:acyl-CoA thioesterase I